MGLDMYLNIRHKSTQGKLEAYEAWETKYSYDEYYDLTQEEKDAYKAEEPEYDEEMYGEELMYWRKANQIHNWFVQNCQNGVDDCGRYIVTLNQLKELCEKILTMTEIKEELRPTYPNGWFTDPVYVMKDVRLLTDEGLKFASEHLPSRSGFFFGNTDYDEYYVHEVNYTANELAEVIHQIEEEYNEDYIIEYTSSW